MVEFEFVDCSWNKGKLGKLEEKLSRFFADAEIPDINKIEITINKPVFLAEQKVDRKIRQGRVVENRINEEVEHYAAFDVCNAVLLQPIEGVALIQVKDSLTIDEIEITMPHELSHLLVGVFDPDTGDRIDAEISSVFRECADEGGFSKFLRRCLAQRSGLFMHLTSELAAEKFYGEKWPDLRERMCEDRVKRYKRVVSEYKKVHTECLEKEEISPPFYSYKIFLVVFSTTYPLLLAVLTQNSNHKSVKQFVNLVKDSVPELWFKETHDFLEKFLPRANKYAELDVDKTVEIGSELMKTVCACLKSEK